MQTSAVQPNANLGARQRQIRGFVIAWLGLTLLMGALTFVGIYYATGLVDDEADTTGDDVSVAPLRNEGEALTADAAPGPDSAVENIAPAAAAMAVPAAGLPDPGQGGALALQATSVPTPTPLPINEQGFQLGIQVQSNPDPNVYKIWMDEVRDKLKLKWIKEQVRWQDIEPAQGQYEWGALDVTFAQAKEYGINVMVSVVTAPAWAREPGNQRLDEVGPPADPQTYATFLAVLLQRYRGQIQAVEVWNEMNLDREWASVYGLSAPNYVTLLRTAYQTIKAVDPGIIVISGALSPTGVNDGVAAYDDFVYMDMLIQAGVLDWADCVGAHHNGINIGPSVPWNSVPNDPTALYRGPFDNPHHSWSFYSTLHGYAQRIQAAGSDKKLCITEFGWPVAEDLNGYPAGFEFAHDNTLAEQAAFMGEAIELMESWGFVWIAWVWNLNYGAQADWDPTDNNVHYSLLRPEWHPAPAYEAIAQHNFREQ